MEPLLPAATLRLQVCRQPQAVKRPQEEGRGRCSQDHCRELQLVQVEMQGQKMHLLLCEAQPVKHLLRQDLPRETGRAQGLGD